MTLYCLLLFLSWELKIYSLEWNKCGFSCWAWKAANRRTFASSPASLWKKKKKVWLKRAVNIKGLSSINKKGLTIPFVFTNSSVAISQPCVTVLLFHMATGEDLNSAWVAGLSLIHLSGTLCNIKDLSSQKCVAELKSSVVSKSNWKSQAEAPFSNLFSNAVTGISWFPAHLDMNSVFCH